jgi:hypothetical protein
LLVVCVALSVAGQEAAKGIDGYYKYTYRIEAGATNISLMTTEIEQQSDGLFQVTTTVRETSDPDIVWRGGFFGSSLGALGLYMSEERSGLFDMSVLNGLSDVALEPGVKYALPDGCLFQAVERVTIAGLSGIRGIYTQSSLPKIQVALVLAEDLKVRMFLPFPLFVEILYPAAESGGSGQEGVVSAQVSGKIELQSYEYRPTLSEEDGS